MDFDTVIKTRQATRQYDGNKVDREKLNKILEAGRVAPTAKNLQPIKIFVVESEDGLVKIDKASPCRYGAGTVLLICGDKDIAFLKDNHSTYEMDASIVTTHMMLEATNVGVDNIWVEMFDEKVLREEFNLPSNLVPVALLPLGYRSSDCPDSPNHNKRKELDEIVEFV